MIVYRRVYESIFGLKSMDGVSGNEIQYASSVTV